MMCMGSAAVGGVTGLGIKCEWKFELLLTIIIVAKHYVSAPGSASRGCPHCCLPPSILGLSG
jgi:hypothetical protein